MMVRFSDRFNIPITFSVRNFINDILLTTGIREFLRANQIKIINDRVSFFSKVPRKPVGSDGDRNTAYSIFVGEGGGETKILQIHSAHNCFRNG